MMGMPTMKTRRGGGGGGRSLLRGRAFTIIEMLVSVTAMSIIIAAFGQILVQCKRVVITSHQTVRANHRVSATAETLRQDFRRLTRDGFLYIGAASGGRGATVVMTTGEPTHSILGDAKGYGSLVAYALSDNNSVGGYVLWRPEYILASSASTLPDTLNISIGDLKAMNRTDCQTWAMNVLGTMVDIPMPPRTMGEADVLWQAVTDKISVLSIMWTDGTADLNGTDPAELNWYGIDWIPDDSEGTNGHYLTTTKGDGNIELGAGGYGALWTSSNPHNWPVAVKVKYRLDDDELPEGYSRLQEVICETMP